MLERSPRHPVPVLTLLLTILCLLATPRLFAQPGIVDLAQIRGHVTYPDGAPRKGVEVIVFSGGQQYSFITDDTGLYGGLVAAGEALVKAVSSGSSGVMLAPDTTTTVDLVYSVGGAELRIVYSDGTPVTDARPMAWYRLPTGESVGDWPTLIEPGHYSLSYALSNAHDVALRVVDAGARPARGVTQQWFFEQPTGYRLLKVILPKPTSTLIRLVDETGTPVTKVKVEGALTLEDAIDVTANDVWLPGPAPTQSLHFGTETDACTDEAGILHLGKLVPGTYRLYLRAGDLSGKLVRIQVGGAQPAPYVLTKQPRAVSQLVFDPDGTPAVGAEVRVVYTLGTRIVTQRATANANGVVVWPDLPPVTAITWGPRVAPGILPDDAETITTPLPPPHASAHLPMVVLLSLEQLGTEAITVKWSASREAGGLYWDRGMYSPGTNTSVPSVPLRPGTPFAFAITTQTVLMWAAIEPYAFLPPWDDDATLHYPTALQNATTVNLSFAIADGAIREPTAVARVSAMPNDLARYLPDAGNALEMLNRVGLYAPKVNQDGIFSYLQPTGDTAHLLVDLNDAVPPEQLSFSWKATAETDDVRMMLPLQPTPPRPSPTPPPAA
jgi:hypothetical protein